MIRKVRCGGLFNNQIVERHECGWVVRYSEIDASVKDEWERERALFGVDPFAERLSCRISDIELAHRLYRNEHLIACVKEEIETIPAYFAKKHVFLLTDVEGVLLIHSGDASCMAELSGMGIANGTSFAFPYAGVNAISAAMKLGLQAAIIEQEHDLHLFSDWLCVCIPVRQQQRIAGYLDISMHKNEDLCMAAAFLRNIVDHIETKLNTIEDDRKLTSAQFKLQHFGLSPREIEVAMRLLDNQSIQQIAREIFLSEGTVRNYTKAIYRKTNTRGKTELIVKMLVQK